MYAPTSLITNKINYYYYTRSLKPWHLRYSQKRNSAFGHYQKCVYNYYFETTFCKRNVNMD